MGNLRAVICTVLGHVDHGKSSILDRIRGTAIVKSEAGQITQAIGASIVPVDVIKKNCAQLLSALKLNLTIPGLLFIDTPGHEAFTHIRKRGGNLADIAVLVVDINEGMKPQTVEALDILRTYKTPFVVAANKVDLIPGWRVVPNETLAKEMSLQSEEVQKQFDTKLYQLAAQLSEHGFSSDRFDRIESYTKQVAIVPCSAKQSCGVPELVVVIAAVAQKYLEESLVFSPDGPAKGTIIEIKKDKGLGITADAIIFDGSLKKNDTIVVGSLGEPIVAKVKALFEPSPLHEMRDKKSKFSSVQKVVAATGVKISAPGLDNAVAGMPLYGAHNKEQEDNAKEMIRKEVQEVLVQTNDQGLVIKADSLGSLEALLKLLRDKSLPIRRASIGAITRKDIVDAETNLEKNPLWGVVLGFNVSADDTGVGQGRIRIFTHNVIYSLIDEYEGWAKAEQAKISAGKMESVTLPCKIYILPGYVFRQSNPAIVGVEVLGGTLVSGKSLMKNGKRVALVSAIQQERESISSAKTGLQVAASLQGAVVGRNIKEKDILYSVLNEEEFRKLKELKGQLDDKDIEVLKEIAAIMRKDNPMWGI